MYTSSITIDNVIDALANFIQPFVGSAEIIRAQVNRTSMPVNPFVELTEINQSDLETPTITEDGTNNQITATTPKRIDVQIDFYGPDAGDWCTAIKTVFRSSYATSQFTANIVPMYCSDGLQSPLITGEEQYQSRWTVTASLQYNPAVIVPLQFADVATVAETIAVDVNY